VEKRKGSVLVVDDDRDVRQAAALLLKQHLEQVQVLADPAALPSVLARERIDVVLLDMNFSRDVASGEEGLYHLRQIRSASPQTVVVMITAFGDVELAVRSIREGATDFVMKPWSNDKLLATIFAALDLSFSRRRIEYLSQQNQLLQADSQKGFEEIIGSSPTMAGLFQTIAKVARTDANVLITGENGTGKELVARAIHRQSQRENGAFVGVDMGAVSESLFESELFGHERGAFTDAKQARAGRFELACGGSVFLDEIGNLPLHLQAKILRVLETREVQRLGATSSIPIDVRLISATNVNLRSLVRDNRFREDLLYRINTVEIHLPPLRERLEDLPELVAFFLGVFERKYHKGPKTLSVRAMEKLRHHAWPGNIRELKHAMERAVILGEGDCLDADDFSFRIHDDAEGEESFSLEMCKLDEVEKAVIARVVKKHGGNISRAAEDLGLSRASLYRRMEKHGL